MTKKSKPVPPPAALAPPTTSTTNGKKKSNASKSTPAAKMPLQDVICCVETFNSDGIDSSAGHIQTLKGLGAQVENSGIRVGLTHLIWSNGNIKHLKAAEFMDITVVSPLWVEQCRESASKAPENDFLITSDNVIVSDGKSKLSAPIPDAANTLPEPDSPSLNSSKRASSGSKSKAKSNAVPTESKPPAKSSKKVSPPQKETKSGQPSPPPSPPPPLPPPPPTSSIAKSSKTKSKTQTAHVDEEDDHGEGKTSIKATKKTAPQKEDKKNTSKTEQVRNTSSSSSSTSVHVDCQLIALSGFEGEQRIFLTDLVQSLLTSVQPTASSSSSSKSSLSNFSLIEDDDLSLDSLTTCSHLIAGTDPMRRTLRVIFGMVLGIPIVTQEWLLKCLENRYWVDTLPYLHPRFDRSRTTTKSKQRKQTASLAVYVAVGQSSNPSQEIIQSLINNWHRSHLVTSPMEAEYVIVDNQQSSAEPTIYEMRASISHLFKKSTEESYLSNLLEEGKILTCKILFDCIEAGDLQPHPYAKKSTSSSSSTTVTIKGKKLKIPPPVDFDDDEDEEIKQKPAAKKPRKGTPKRAPKAKVVESADSESDHSNYPTPIKLSLLEEDSPPVHQLKTAQHSLLCVRHDEEKEVVWHGRGKGAKKRPISPEPLPQKNAVSGQVNDNDDDDDEEEEEEEEVITPSRKKSRAALTSPLRSKIALQDLEDDEEDEGQGLLALGGVVSGGGEGEEASPSW